MPKNEKIFQMHRLVAPLEAQPLPRFEICGTTYPNKNYLIHRPHSSTACIEFVAAGKGHVTIDGKSFSPSAGDTYFLPAGMDHHYWSDKNTPWEKHWVNITGDYVMQLAKLHGVDKTYYYPGLDTSDLLTKMQHYAALEDWQYAAERCTALLCELFFRMSGYLYAPLRKDLSPVEKMKLYIHQNETEVIRIEQLAALCGKSTSQAERLFRSDVGVPPYRYALGRKIELAKQLLSETGLSVREIASYLSFEDEFYFSGLFKQKTGISPTLYRKKMAEDSEIKTRDLPSDEV